MATVTGLTKERMLEIEAASVVDGDVDGSGNLILTKHDGSQFNAGHVVGPAAPNLADASTTVKGIAEIATLVEVTTGTDATRFVTPQGVRQERAVVDHYTGIIDPAWSTGLPKVTLDAGQAYSGTVTAYLPGNLDESIIASAKVLLVKTNAGNWAIISSYSSSPRFMRQIPCSLEPGSGWIMYSDPIASDVANSFGGGPAQFGGAGLTYDSTKASKFYVTCTSTGIATASGLMTRTAAPAVGSVIGRFPVALAPARNQIFTVFTSSGVGELAVCVDGTIRFVMGNTGFIDLDNLRWRTAASVTAGAATFVPMSLLSGWASLNTIAFTSEPGTVVHTPGYTIDSDMVAVFEGIVVATAAKSASSDVAVLSALTAAAGIHLPCATVAGFGYCRIGVSVGAPGVGKTLNTGMSASIGQWFSVANFIWLDSTSPTTPKNQASGVNGWTVYEAINWAGPSFAKTPDGLVLAFGLWASGTIGAAMTLIPDGWRPRYTLLAAIVSNAALGRVDVGDATKPNYGSQSVQASNGNSVWYSLDGISWPAYR